MDLFELIIAHDDRVYTPDDDSYLLIDSISPNDSSKALEIGVGSGIVSLNLAKKVDEVFGCDINPFALELSKKNASLNHINNLYLFSSNLFSSIKIGTLFDIIVFNPPYLPVDSPPRNYIDLSYNGGIDGGEYIRKFLNYFGMYLSPKGRAYLLQSSLYPLELTKKSLRLNHYDFEIINSLKLDFETLYVLEIRFAYNNTI